MTVEPWIDLRCHPSTRTEAVRAIQVLVRRSAGAELQLTFRLDGDIPRISIPSPVAPRIGSDLWRHTCFEAFIAIDGQRAYHEFNFAPSGEWCIYALSGYRNGSPLADEAMRPEILVRSTQSRLELDALVRLDRLSAIHPRARSPDRALGGHRGKRRALILGASPSRRQTGLPRRRWIRPAA